MVINEVDILIVGGGLTGAALLLALKNLPYKTLLIDQKPLTAHSVTGFDARSLALSPSSNRILQRLKMWPAIEKDSTPIHKIHISQQHRFAKATLSGPVNEPLGFIVELSTLDSVLQSAVQTLQILAPVNLVALDPQESTVKLIHNDRDMLIKAKLIVAADGTHSTIRSLMGLKAAVTDYNQQAIVANIGLSKPHGYQAYERFTASGLLALLPMKEDRASLVWAMHPSQALQLIEENEATFLKTLQKNFGYHLGRFLKVGQRSIFPLTQVVMKRPINWPVVFIGNAAQTLHPVGGQGFNLGLRDVATLAQCIKEKGLTSSMLEYYFNWRKDDQKMILRLTDGLIRLFTSRFPGIGLARDLGLIAFDNSLFLKQKLSHLAKGFHDNPPDLVCGIDLEQD